MLLGVRSYQLPNLWFELRFIDYTFRVTVDEP